VPSPRPLGALSALLMHTATLKPYIMGATGRDAMLSAGLPRLRQSPAIRQAGASFSSDAWMAYSSSGAAAGLGP
jgi:hypothetical protein